MSAVEILQNTGRSESPAKPKDSANVPLEEANEGRDAAMETEDPLPNVQEEVTKIPIKTEPKTDMSESGEESNVKTEELSIKPEDVTEALSIKPEDVTEALSIKPGDVTETLSIKPEVLEGVVTEVMVKEEQELQEQAMEKEKKLAEDQEKLWKQMTDEDRNQRYQRLKFLLSKSNMYTQYLIDRMDRQTEEEKKKRERQQKRLKKKEDKLKEQQAKEQEVVESSSQSSDVSETSTRKSRKRKSDLMSPEAVNTPKTPGKRSKKSAKTKQTEQTTAAPSEDKENEATSDNTQGEASGNTGQKTTDTSDRTTMATTDDTTEKAEPGSATTEELGEEEATSHFPRAALLPPKGNLRACFNDLLSLQVLFENGVNGILADEMGLGKTVQCIALLAHLVAMGVSGPFLVVGPLSTVPNWYNEFKRFTPKVPVILYHGSKDERRNLRNKMRVKHQIKKNVEVQPVIITSYEIAMNDRTYMQHFDWKYLIVDEGHRLKNSHCRLIRELRLYKTTHRLLLTGTPLQNNLAELWSLLNFLLPEIFDDLGSFEAWFDVTGIEGDAADERIVAEEQRGNIISMLHQILTPFMLRRLKSDVELLIPPKREVMVMAPLTSMQKDYYSSIVDKTIMDKIQKKYEDEAPVESDAKGRPKRRSTKNKINYRLMVEDPKDEAPKKNKKAAYEEDLEAWVQTMIEAEEERSAVNKKEVKDKKAQITIKMQNSMMQLRKCCSHPYLLEHPIDADSGHLIADETLVKNSGKMLMLDRLLPELKKRGHKVLIFSQMTKMLNILESYCEIRNYKYCRLDGSRSVENRGEQIESFNEDANMFLFLVSTRAGGLGINLTAADTVIIYDSDWNPQCDLQAQDRCHRIGQTKPVLVYRFVTANTIDQRIVERAAAKRKLEKLIIHKGKFKTGMNEFSTSLKPISAPELLELLRSRDHEAVIQGSEKNVISNKDLDNLLDRSDLYQKLEKMKGNKTTDTKRRKSKAKDPVIESKTFKVLETHEGGFTNQAEEETSSQLTESEIVQT
ncbi:lymphocyte-specific helicase-like [Haliotis rubra]|uniref:lymphocyte-specific helicase-like n=1 Tax=Haliotis rubra TaxID=36100 RepID=UPI001EE5FCEA|nr:lymphocyte-specific helicase-like [Haliotis rubra]